VGGDRDDLFVEEGAELFGERLVDEELDVVEVDVARVVGAFEAVDDRAALDGHSAAQGVDGRVGDGQPLPRMW
jgi:hypothetical protein